MSSPTTRRPPFIISSADVPERIHHYPRSTEGMAPSRPIGRTAGLMRIGLHLVRVPPGTRTSWPHAESAEEEFAYLLEGEVDAWIDGEREAVLLVGGEADKAENRIYYPLHPGRREDLPWSRWWDDIPRRPLGTHDGTPRPR